MDWSNLDYPCLRPLEAEPHEERGRIIIRDPTQLAKGALLVGEEQLTLLTLLDGTRQHMEIQMEFARRTGQMLLGHELSSLLGQLGEAGYLDGPPFEAYYQELVDQYRAAPYRPLRDRNSYGAPASALHEFLDSILDDAPQEDTPAACGKLAGIVTPHLDFPRGSVCYGAGFNALGDFRPTRVVVLGTNHFGRSRSVVTTGKDWETPWGVVPTDREFIERLGAACGANLAPYELDHLREHSIELQVIWLHHLLGDGFRVVPFLCPDPSRKRGTAPGDPGCVDLRHFAEELGRLVREDPEPTLLIASADLSHVGGYFGDEAELTDEFVQSIGAADQAGLAHVDRNDPEAYRAHMGRTKNPTRVCSVGCIYTLMTALGPDAKAQRLRYHQAVTPEWQNCVTCAAYAFYV